MTEHTIRHQTITHITHSTSNSLDKQLGYRKILDAVLSAGGA